MKCQSRSNSLGEPARERLDAEPLRRVVAAGDEVDAELSCRHHRRLGRLAGEEGVVAGRRGGGEQPGGATGHDRHAPDLVRPVQEGQRLASAQRRPGPAR